MSPAQRGGTGVFALSVVVGAGALALLPRVGTRMMQAVTVVERLPLLPLSLSSWATLIGIIGLFVGYLWGWSKWVHKLNGLGERVKVMEESLPALTEAVRKLDRQIELAGMTVGNLREQVGAATKSAEECADAVGEFRLVMGSRMEDMRREWEQRHEQKVERLARIEEALRYLNRQHREDRP